MDLGLKGKVALIAGGSQGLGRAVALEMAREGAKVAVCALDDPSLPESAQIIKKATGVDIYTIPADVSKEEEARTFVRKSIERYGTVDILVNNAGCGGPYPARG